MSQPRATTGHRLLSVLLSLQFALGLALPGVVGAAPLGTLDYLQQGAAPQDGREVLQARIQAQLAREGVAAQLQALGVAPELIEARLQALSAGELQAMDARLQTLPAGGSLVGVLGVVFVVLIALELVGVTDVFKRL